MTIEPTQKPSLPRRPPAAPSQWATVTKLGTADDGPHAVPDTRRRPPAPALTDGALALASPQPEPPEAGAPTPALTVVPAAGPRDEVDVKAWAARFAQAVVECLGGDRPVSQLLRWTSSRVYADLDRRQRILSRGSVAEQRARRIRPQVRSVHVFHPTAMSAEVSVHVRHGQRSRALAARLEHENGRWQCTALLLG